MVPFHTLVTGVAERFLVVRVVAGIVGAVHMEQRITAGAVEVAALIATLTEVGCVGSGIIIPPDAGAALVADYSPFFQASGTKFLVLKFPAVFQGMRFSADGA
jgi:D-mannonate dehydratase